MAFSLPSATYTARPSGLTPIPRGRPPTGTVATTWSVAVSMMVTSFERSLETYASGPASAGAASIARARAVTAHQARARIIDRPPSGASEKVDLIALGGEPTPAVLGQSPDA